MTDIMKLADDYAWAYMSFGESASRAALQSAIEALQGECAEHKENAIRNARQAVAFRAERDALQAKLDELQAQEPVKFLVNGARFKLANCGPSSSGFVGFPKELAGRWVALVAADDDCHLKLAAPKALEPLERVAECAARLVEHADFQLGGILSADSKAKDIPSKAVSQVKSRHLAALRDSLSAHGITKGTPT